MIREALAELGSFHKLPSARVESGTVLYGNGGVCDSIALVHLIALLEKKLQKQVGRRIVLASAKAFSSRKSPFQTVSSLAAFMEDALKEAP